MTSKSNTSIPKNTVIGLRQITRQLENITFSKEVNNLLSDIEGRIEFSYAPENGHISHKIVSARDGTPYIQTQEFERLGKYKTMVNEAKDEEEMEARKASEIATYHNLMAGYRVSTGQQPPARMLVPNQSKFGNFKKSLDVIEGNIKIIETLVNSDYKDYIVTTATILHRVYMRGLIACFGDEKYEQATHEDVLFRVGIPKWMETKLTDKSFAKDAKHDALPLLFPRGNFLKSLTFRTCELKADHFMVANRIVLFNSQSIISLGRNDALRDWFIPESNRMKDDLREQYEKFTWPMLSPGTVQDFLEPRKSGINVRTFSPLTAPRERVGQPHFRPESAFQKEVRDIKNQQTKLVSTMLDFFHFIPRVSDPISDYWSAVMNTSDWVISPDKTIYAWLDEATNRDRVLGFMLRNDNGRVKRCLSRIVTACLGIPAGTLRSNALEHILVATTTNDAVIFFPDAPDRITFISTFIDVTMDNLRSVDTLDEVARQRVQEFRGRNTETAIRSNVRDRVRSRGMLTSTTRKILNRIVDEDMRKAAAKWLREDFSKDKLREVAAVYYVSAVQDLSLGINLDEEEDEEEEFFA